VPLLTKLVQTGRPLDRLPAVEAQWSLTNDSAATVPVLIELLKADDLRPPANYVGKSEHRLRVAAALERIGPAAKDAVPVLLQVIQDHDAAEAGRAIRFTVHHRDEEDRAAEEHQSIRQSCLRALQRIDPEAAKRVKSPNLQ